MTRSTDWLGTGHERRAKLFAVVALSLFAATTVGVLSAPEEPRLTVADERPTANTLVAIQGYGGEGRAVELNPDGEVVWEYANATDVFDVEALGPDRVQLSTAEVVAEQRCPPAYRNDGTPNCVRNSLRIVDRESKETLWEYAWHDVELHEHELHDADHYEVGGEDRWVLVDMGNDRVFAVDRAGERLWQWNATDTYDRPDRMGPESDWTHMNDVDRLRPGVFQVSLRNFDTVVELRVEEGNVSVSPVVGPNEFAGRGDEGPLFEQHNPDRLADGHLLVADSERDRVVELNADGEVVWEYGGSALFDWPRDADRLSNGHTLVTDSYNERVVEIDEDGTVVWSVKVGSLPYEADRLPGEGSSDTPTATGGDIPSSVRETLVGDYAARLGAISKYVLPNWAGEHVFPLAGAVFALVGAAVEGVRSRRTGR